MTKEQLAEMFTAQDAWDRVNLDKEIITQLTEALRVLADSVTRLSELLKH